MNKVFDIITERIMKELERGEIPWRKPWSAAGEIPKNLASKKEYRGINIIILATAGFASPYFVSFKQCQKLGGSVKKGARGIPVVFWKTDRIEVEDPDTGEATLEPRWILRYYTVFNAAEQCEGLEKKIPVVEKDHKDKISACEEIVEGFAGRPETTFGGDRAYYRPRTDTIGMPHLDDFGNSEEFYSTYFHEFVHSTGAEKRVGRPGVMDFDAFGSHEYSKEELVAEMGAAFLCGITGIESKTIENSGAYIRSWLKKLSDDRKMVVHAAAAAQKAFDHITGKRFAESGGEVEEAA
jgi:antirestriction protein ArdC